MFEFNEEDAPEFATDNVVNVEPNDNAEVEIDNQGQLSTNAMPDVPVPIIEFISEQCKDSLCREISSSDGTPRSEFNFNSQ